MDNYSKIFIAIGVILCAGYAMYGLDPVFRIFSMLAGVVGILVLFTTEKPG